MIKPKPEEELINLDEIEIPDTEDESLDGEIPENTDETAADEEGDQVDGEEKPSTIVVLESGEEIDLVELKQKDPENYTEEEKQLLSPYEKVEWESLDFLVRPGDNSLVRFVVDPEEPDNIYLSLDTTMYRSVDGGKDWEVQKITDHFIYSLAIDPDDPEKILAGIWQREQ